MTLAFYESHAILDPIHGLIRLSEHELKIVDQPVFRRLRSIKQNGLLWYVFPSATHNRFEHSLGVLFVAQRMWEALFVNSKASAERGRVALLSSAEEGQAVNFSDLDETTADSLRKILRLAALCHDLGHGPLSHTFEQFAPTIAQLRSILSDERLGALEGLKGILLSDKDGKPIAEDGRCQHEALSCVFFAHGWRHLGQDDETARAVSAAILGQGYEAVRSSPLRQWLPLLHDMIASAPADADRMDYLERDSRALGVTYGLFDRNRVLKSLLCYKTRDSFRLGIKRSGLRAIENLVQARFELYVQVYYHKTNRAIELLLKGIAEDSRSAGIVSATTLDTLIASFVDLDDSHFLRQLKEAKASATIPALVEKLLSRAFPKRVANIKPVRTETSTDTKATRKRAEKVSKELVAAFPDSRFTIDKVEPKATKDLDEGAALLERMDGGIYKRSETSWKEASPIIRVLEDDEQAIFRIYIAESDQELRKRIRVHLEDSQDVE